ncbi:MAG: right-handed parallel beta-helix repeat-containing protein [Bacteroidota bacterium]
MRALRSLLIFSAALMLSGAAGCAEPTAAAGADTEMAEPAADHAPVAEPVLLGDRAESAACPPGQVRDAAERCRAAERVYAPNGRVFWVDQRHPNASDANPGTRDAPWRSIGRATGRGVVEPGDAVLIRSGVYREFVRPQVGGTSESARVTYAAYPGDEVVVSGTVEANGGWFQQGETWTLPWTYGSMERYGDDPVFRREMLIADGTVLRPVADRAALAPGTFWIEGSSAEPRAVWARFPGDRAPSSFRSIEVAVEPHLFAPLGRNYYAECGDADMPGWIRLAGFTFRHATNHAQWGVLCAGSIGGLVEDVTVAWTNGSGIDPGGRQHVFRRVRALDNGQIGWSGSCVDCLFEDCEASRNNWKGYDPFWEAGGGKWSLTERSTFRRFRALDNEGPGLWLDIENYDNVIEGTYAEGNSIAGIMLEHETRRTLVQHNVAVGTRWNAWSGAGLLSQAASENVIVHNTFAGNEGHGLWLRLDPDRRAPDGRNVVASNVIVGNGTNAAEAYDVQVRGETQAEARSTRFIANVYSAHGPIQPGREVQSFFFMPTGSADWGGDYRGSDLATWQRYTGSDAEAKLVQVPDDLQPVAQRWADLPARLGTDLARSLPPGTSTSTRVRPYPHAGANPAVVRSE